MDNAPFHLRGLPASFRLGVTLLLLVLAGGFAASASHLYLHHENRDEQPGLSMDDLVGAYHGINTTAPLVGALEGGHPEEIPADVRQALLGWLASDQITEQYDNLDLGDKAPAELMDQHCSGCHSRQATAGDGIGKRVPLEYWDDVKPLAFSREVAPTDTEIVVASAHTHALTMSTISLVLLGLALCTRWPRGLLGALVAIGGLGLLLDLSGWFIARASAAFVPVLAIGGGCWAATMGCLILLILLDLWLPIAQPGQSRWRP